MSRCKPRAQDATQTETQPRVRLRTAARWLVPSIFIGAGLLSGISNVVSVALNVLSNYLTDFLRGKRSAANVKASVLVVEDGNGTYKRVEYEGPAEGLKQLVAAIGKVQRGS